MRTMMVGTHSLLPVCGCVLLDRLCQAAGLRPMFSGWQYCAIGVAGFLPDILSPHVSLEARQSSLSHTVWAVAVMLPLMFVGARWMCRKGSWIAVALACWVAYGLHLAADAISGGIAWLYPWRGESVGGYLIPSPHWIYYDAGFIILAWVMFRVLPAPSRKEALHP